MATVFGKQPTAEMDALLRRVGDNDFAVSHAAQREFAQALSAPLKQGVMDGDVVGGIYDAVKFEPGESVEWPLDFVSPGTEDQYVAYTIPNTGRIPDRHIESDYLMVSTFKVGCALDWDLKWARDTRWDIMARVLQVMEAMFKKKSNKDGYATLLAAAKGRNSVVYDDQATAGLFTKRVIAQAETWMTRNAGGNSTSLTHGQLTDVYMSPEAKQDVLSWDLTQIPEALRQAIFQNWSNGGISQIGPVKLHGLHEFGVDQEFQRYLLNVLGATLPTDKLEFVLGLDLLNRDSFVHPVRQLPQMYEDLSFHRADRAGMYARGEHGWAALDSRRAMLLAV